MPYIKVTAVHGYLDNEYKKQYIGFKVTNFYR